MKNSIIESIVDNILCESVDFQPITSEIADKFDSITTNSDVVFALFDITGSLTSKLSGEIGIIIADQDSRDIKVQTYDLPEEEHIGFYDIDIDDSDYQYKYTKFGTEEPEYDPSKEFEIEREDSSDIDIGTITMEMESDLPSVITDSALKSVGFRYTELTKYKK